LAATTASLAGTLDVDDQASFTPTGADTFDVVVAETSVSGTFGTVTPSGFSASPNTNYTSTEVQVTFAAALTPTVKVTSTASSISYGTAVTLTATVTGSGPIATGTVQFMAGSADLGTPQTLSNGVATLATSTLPVGSLSITGAYSGDSSYKPGTSPAITVTVAKVTTTLVLEPSVTNAGAGQPVTLNAIVTPKAPSTASPTGSVTFYNGTKKIGSATLSGGVASVKTSFKAGKFTLKATYPGTSDFGSSSGTATETVVSTGSKTSITESATRVLTAVPVTFTATVKASSGTAVPTGDVQFYNGVSTLGRPVKLNSKGVATASDGFAHGGTYSITAAYLGTKSEGGSTSSAVSLLVQEPGYRMVGQDGGVFDFGGAGYYGSLPHENIVPATPVVGMASTPTGLGYWLVTQGAHVYPFGDAKTYSADSGTPTASIVAIVPTADGKGYWLMADNGTVWRYGDAANYKDKTGLTGVVSAAGTPDGKGYWIATSAGKVYAFGDAKTESPIKGQGAVSGTISSMAPTVDGKGYYLVNTSGVVYSYGDAKAYGNAKSPTASITGIAESPRGTGYWLAGADGSVYALGSAPNDGSVVKSQLTAPICGTSAFP
ncbi:MAG: Ig-like domain repeat protein, partial [Acidimicrobiales bacterium]